MDYQIVKNKAQCNRCKDIVESKHRHDYQSCKCGGISVDGGKDYLRRSLSAPEGMTDLSTTKPSKKKAVVKADEEPLSYAPSAWAVPVKRPSLQDQVPALEYCQRISHLFKNSLLVWNFEHSWDLEFRDILTKQEAAKAVPAPTLLEMWEWLGDNRCYYVQRVQGKWLVFCDHAKVDTGYLRDASLPNALAKMVGLEADVLFADTPKKKTKKRKKK